MGSRNFNLEESDKGFVKPRGAGKKAQASAPPPPPPPPERQSKASNVAELLMVAIDDLAPSPFNPRKSYDKAYIAELSADIDAHGVLQPLRVRRTPGLMGGGGKFTTKGFELIFGHCRLMAAEMAGLKKVPCLVVEATDAEVSVLQLVENLKRKDLDHFELAEGLAALRDRHGLTVEQIAQMVGLHQNTVWSTLKLKDLNTDVGVGLQKAGFGKEHALLLARLPSEAQPKVLEEFIVGRDNRAGPMTVKNAREWVAERWMVDLRGAPFDLADEKLCPEAGSCKACPKRSGNMQAAADVVEARAEKRELSHGRAPAAGQNVCFDTKCHQQKLAAHAKLDAKARGLVVLSDKENAAIFGDYGHLNGEGNDKYCLANDVDYDDVKQRQHKELLDADGLKKQMVLGITPRGDVVELLLLHGLDPAKRQAGKKVSEKERQRAKKKPKQSKEAKAKELAEQAFREKVVDAAVNTVAGAAGSRFALNNVVAELVRECLVELAYRLNPTSIADRRQVKGDVAQMMKRAGAADLPGLLLEVCFGPELTELPPAGGYSRALVAACKLTGVDIKKVEKDVKAAGKAAA